MPSRSIFPAGAVTFGAAGIAWQGFDGSLSGSWANPQDWNPATVPAAADPAVISAGTATTAWTVTESGESAASLLLDMNLGTLEATTALTVGGVLTQVLGTLLADAGTTITAAALDQTGGTVILNDDGSGTTTLDSAGTDSVDGTVTLVSGAQWNDAALGIGLGTLDSTVAVGAAVTLGNGSGFSLLSVTGALQVGADPGSQGAGGVGSLELDGDNGAIAGSLTIENGSAISGNPLSGMAIGSGAGEIQGAIDIGTGGVVQADRATFGLAVVNDGTFAVVPWQDGSQTGPGDVLIGGSLQGAGAVTVAAAATLNVQGSVEIDAGGGLSVAAGGTLVAASGSAGGDTGVYLAGGALTLDQATLDSFGTADFANSDATLTGGAVWTGNTLSIAPGYSDGTAAVATVTLSGGSLLSAANGIDVGNDAGVGTAATSDPGGVGTLDVSGGSAVSANSMAVLNGSLVSLDATSTVLLGSSADEAGTVVVGTDGLLVADMATLLGDVADGGTFDVTADPTGIAGDLLIGGSLTGTGGVSVVAGSTLEVGNAGGFSGHLVIGGGGELVLDAGGMASGLLSATGGTASIDVKGQSFDSAGFAPSYDAGTGQLVFGDAASQSTLAFAPGLALEDFSLSADAAGTGTLITEVACFAAGTRIATERGDVPVEALRVGEPVRLEGGGTAPVAWLGHRRVACRRHRRPLDVQPVRVAAHAFGLGRPCRDLLLSPDHAVFVDGVLIPVRYLLNGATLRQEDFLAVTYWHVELPAHGVLLAEGLPAESFLNTGNRDAFANGGGAVAAHPDFARSIWAQRGCAPLVTAGETRDRVYTRLLAQAFALGWQARDAGGGASEWVAPGCGGGRATADRT